MAEVALAIGGRSYTVACRDGGEEHLRGLAARVDAKVEEARGAVGTANEVRQLLFAALLLADDASEGASEGTSREGEGGTTDAATATALAKLAARLEALADTLEDGAASA